MSLNKKLASTLQHGNNKVIDKNKNVIKLVVCHFAALFMLITEKPLHVFPGYYCSFLYLVSTLSQMSFSLLILSYYLVITLITNIILLNNVFIIDIITL